MLELDNETSQTSYGTVEVTVNTVAEANASIGSRSKVSVYCSGPTSVSFAKLNITTHSTRFGGRFVEPAPESEGGVPMGNDGSGVPELKKADAIGTVVEGNVCRRMRRRARDEGNGNGNGGGSVAVGAPGGGGPPPPQTIAKYHIQFSFSRRDIFDEVTQSRVVDCSD